MSLFNSEELSDCQIHLFTDEVEATFPAHLTILANKSQYFRKWIQFYKDKIQSMPKLEIDITNIGTLDEALKLIEYLYDGGCLEVEFIKRAKNLIDFLAIDGLLGQIACPNIKDINKDLTTIEVLHHQNYFTLNLTGILNDSKQYNIIFHITNRFALELRTTAVDSTLELSIANYYLSYICSKTQFKTHDIIAEKLPDRYILGADATDSSTRKNMIVEVFDVLKHDNAIDEQMFSQIKNRIENYERAIRPITMARISPLPSSPYQTPVSGGLSMLPSLPVAPSTSSSISVAPLPRIGSPSVPSSSIPVPSATGAFSWTPLPRIGSPTVPSSAMSSIPVPSAARTFSVLPPVTSATAKMPPGMGPSTFRPNL